MANKGRAVGDVAQAVYPSIHVLVYSDAGGGKSDFAASFSDVPSATPILVWCWDPFGKETPYLKRGTQKPVEIDAASGTPYVDVLHRQTGALLIRVEYYLDADPQSPEAYARFLRRMTLFGEEQARWRTVVNDSVTFMELAARKLQQYHLNPSAKDPRQWYGGSKESLEEMLMIRFGALPMNVVVCAHVDEDKDEMHGYMVRYPMAPGKLKKALPSGFGEIYRPYVARDDKGQRVHVMQTQADTLWTAASQIDAPNPCPNRYADVWRNWKE